ncbi:unnamed protein product [Adineta ricciae]|uniref:Uncharacterized protein n=1 Tax=Adineta ricciae TaxID=249248 RepID=A0A815SP25_ADIRI|nr:unnamed protein product [Adineta ricciae]CAF1495332.1 unnamed protein product [Adineta ricciae]
MDTTDTDIKDNTSSSQIQPSTTPPPPTTINSSPSSSPSCATLLVIDDSSHSEEELAPATASEPVGPRANDIPVKPTPTQTSDIPAPTTVPPFTLDTNNTAEQQRRRNSSIAKLLGGQPLNNHQYEEITQQILEDQSAQSTNYNTDSGIDTGNQRPRSSITRTLLMNHERANSFGKLSPKPSTTSSPSAPRDFDYLIRREPDKPENDYSSTTLQRNNSATRVMQNVNSPTNPNAQFPIQSKLKRKRSLVAASLPTPNIPPFSFHEPFELESSGTNSTQLMHSTRSQNDSLHFDSSKRSRHSNSEPYNLPVNNSSTPSSFPYSKFNMNSTLYDQFRIHQNSAHSNTCSTSCNCPRYSHSTKLALPVPVPHYPATPSRSNSISNTTPSVSRKTKSMFGQNDEHDPPRQRSYSNSFNQLNLSSASSSEPSVPLKKRLLHAYNNEQRPTTPL